MVLMALLDTTIEPCTMDRKMYIPTWLPAFRLGDLAEAMGAKMDIRGLDKFEKLHEGMDDGCTSDKAKRMTVDELREALKEIP